MELTSLYRQLNQYRNLENKILNIVNILQDMKNPYNNCIDSINNNYLYDGCNKYANKLLNQYNEISNITVEFVNYILPDIRNKILRLRKEIAALEAINIMGGA